MNRERLKVTYSAPNKGTKYIIVRLAAGDRGHKGYC